MKQRMLAALLAAAVALSLLPTTVWAEDGGNPTECTCTVPCTAQAKNPDCTVCGAEDAALEACARYEPADPITTAESIDSTNTKETAPASDDILVSVETQNNTTTVLIDFSILKEGDIITVNGESFEFDTDGILSNSGNITVDITLATPPSAVAEAFYNALNDSLSGTYLISKPSMEENTGSISFTNKNSGGPPVTISATPWRPDDFQVSGGTAGTDYEYHSNTLTIKTGAPLIISGSTTQDKIVIDTNVTANVTLQGVSINVDGCAFAVKAGGTANITLSGDNTLVSGSSRAGLQVPETAAVTISGTGTLTATGGEFGAGIGGDVNKSGGSITICSGTVVAKGGGGGAGIGGGGGNGSASGGNSSLIEISGGLVKATGGEFGAGIGGGFGFGFGGGNGGTINIDGDAVIFAQSGGSTAAHIGGSGRYGSNGSNGTISTPKGVIFEGDSGVVHGSPALPSNITIPAASTLTVPDGSTLTIPQNVTLTNLGTLTNRGTITNWGTIANTKGTINNHGTIAVNQPNGGEVNAASTTTVTFADAKGGSTQKAAYGDKITITATAQQKSTNALQKSAQQNQVAFYVGDGASKKSLGTAEVTTNGGKANAALEITINEAFSLQSNTITAEFGGADSLLNSTGTADLHIEKATPTLTLTVDPESPSAYPGDITLTATLSGAYPDSSNKAVTFMVNNQIVTNAQTDASGNATYTITMPTPGTYQFGASFADNAYNNAATAAEINNYTVSPGTQEALKFQGLNASYTYGDAPITFSVSGGAGTGLISCKSSAPSIASVSGSTLTIHKAGNFTLTATKAADSNYKEATVSMGITVSPRNISDATVEITGSRVYTGGQLQPAFKVTDGSIAITGDDYSFDYGKNIDAGANAGSVTLSGRGNYTGTKNVAFDIEKAAAETPRVNIDYQTEMLTGFEPSGSYLVNSQAVAPQQGQLAINSNWFGTSVNIVQKEDANHTESAAQAVNIPARPDAPTVHLQIHKTASTITVTNAGDFSRCEFSLDGSSWNDTGAFSNLDAAKDYTLSVRYKSAAGKFASVSAEQSVTTVKADGSVIVKPGESAETGDSTVANGGDKITISKGDQITVIIPPASGDAAVNSDGKVTVPGGSTVQTGTGPVITVGPGNNGTVDGDGLITVPEGGQVQVGSDPVTVITPPDGGSVIPNEDGKVTVPGGSTVQTGTGPVITVGPDNNGTVDGDGAITVPENGQVQVGSDPVTVITPPDGGVVIPNEDGAVTVPGGSSVQVDGGKPAIVPGDGGAVNPSDGSVTPNPHTVTFDRGDGGESETVSVPHGENLTRPADPTRSGYSFGGWYQEPACATAWNFDTDTVTASMTLYAKWTAQSSGSDHDRGDDVTPVKPDKPNPPANGESKVAGTVDKNGAVTVKVSNQSIDAAINAAKKQNGKNGISVTVSIEFKQNANSLSISLSKEALRKLIAQNVKELKITSGFVSMGFNLEALKEIQKSVTGDLIITAKKLDVKTLSMAAQTTIGNRPVFDFSIQSGGKAITTFGKGAASIWIPYTLAENETAGNVQMFYLDSKGAVNALAGSSYAQASQAVIFRTTHFSIYGVGRKADTPAFTDIANHWAVADIEFAAARGLLSGTDANQFSPDAGLTRAMLVTALGRLAGIDPAQYQTGSFTDVPAAASYAPYVNWAVNQGIIKGTTRSTFAPNQTVTRQEMAVILSDYAKATGCEIPKTREAITFADNRSIDSRAAASVKQMQMVGVINGKDGNKFDPTGTATRAEASAMLRRYVELIIDPATAQGWDRNDSGKWMYYENGRPVTGKQTIGGTVYRFRTKGQLTKIDAVAPKTEKYTIYTIKKGDTLWGIAASRNCTVAEIAALNQSLLADPNKIIAGQQIKIPQE